MILKWSGSQGNAPRTGSGFSQVLRVGCIAFLVLIVLKFILGFLGSSLSQTSASRVASKAESRQAQSKDENDDDDEWEDYYGADAEENFGLIMNVQRGVEVGGGMVILPDGRLYNSNTGKVKKRK